MSLFSPSMPALPPTPTPPAPPPVFGQGPGQKPGAKNPTPTFLGGMMAPGGFTTTGQASGNYGGKTLLGT